MNPDLLAGIFILIFILISATGLIHTSYHAFKRVRIFKDTVPDICPDCNEPMEFRNGLTFIWKCKKCGRKMLLLLDEEKNIVTSELGKVSRKRRIATTSFLIPTHAAIFSLIYLDIDGILFIILGATMIILSVLFAIGKLPKKTRYTDKFLSSVNLKYSIKKIRLDWCGIFLLGAIVMFGFALGLDLTFLLSLAIILSVCFFYWIYVLENNLECEKKNKDLG